MSCADTQAGVRYGRRWIGFVVENLCGATAVERLAWTSHWPGLSAPGDNHQLGGLLDHCSRVTGVICPGAVIQADTICTCDFPAERDDKQR
jgi:hypothetical protein